VARKVLIIVENLPVPFDSRVWKEATALYKSGYEVTGWLGYRPATDARISQELFARNAPFLFHLVERAVNV